MELLYDQRNSDESTCNHALTPDRIDSVVRAVATHWYRFSRIQ